MSVADLTERTTAEGQRLRLEHWPIGRLLPSLRNARTHSEAQLAETAVTIAGDIWCLGAHRVACGDSTDADTVKALLGDVVPVLMVTDPPYGVAYDPEWRHEQVLAHRQRSTTTSARIGLPRGHC